MFRCYLHPSVYFWLRNASELRCLKFQMPAATWSLWKPNNIFQIFPRPQAETGWYSWKFLAQSCTGQNHPADWCCHWEDLVVACHSSRSLRTWKIICQLVFYKKSTRIISISLTWINSLGEAKFVKNKGWISFFSNEKEGKKLFSSLVNSIYSFLVVIVRIVFIKLCHTTDE